MKRLGPLLRWGAAATLALAVAGACPFDDTLREYLGVHFWLPFSRHAEYFAKPNVRRISVAFAGMTAAEGGTPVENLRAAYQAISDPLGINAPAPDAAKLHQALAAARADPSLTPREKEEVELIDAKIDMRLGEQEDGTGLLDQAKGKLRQFLKTARTAAYRSEARGWIAHIDYLEGNRTAAGKFYLDELNRNGSNLDRETLLASLQMTYGYNGGQGLLDHLGEYFDTPEHAAFAIQLATNPSWNRNISKYEPKTERKDNAAQIYGRVKDLLENHRNLFRSGSGSDELALLGMRTSLRMGDPPGALRIAERVPASAPVRSDPDFEWMLASGHFLSRDYAGAEKPLLALFRSSRSSYDDKAAAAYGLCGVYEKTGNAVEQIRYALWLSANGGHMRYYSGIPQVEDRTVYWAVSGWDLKLLLDYQAPLDALQSFVKQNPNAPQIRLVEYSIAVRLARQNRYAEAAEIYQSIHAYRRAPRMRQLAKLYQQASRTDLSAPDSQKAKFALAEFISQNPDGIYFNDALWRGYQNYALTAPGDARLTLEERKKFSSGERKLKDDQEERWRAYLILRDVVRDAGKTPQGRQAAQLAVRDLRGISTRFGRRDEIRQADLDLSRWLGS